MLQQLKMEMLLLALDYEFSVETPLHRVLLTSP